MHVQDETKIVEKAIEPWRPPTGDDFVGAKNRPRVERLHRGAIARSLPLLLLLIGPYGCAKTSLARFIIKVYRCLRRTADGNPCHHCDHCDRQGTLFNGDGYGFPQYEFDCQNKEDRAELQLALRQIRSSDEPIALFLDQLEGLSESALNALLTFLHDFKGVFIAAITDHDFKKMNKKIPALCERLHKVPLFLPETKEMVEFFQEKAKTPQWGITADEEMLRVMVKASKRSFRTCLKILQAAHDNDPPVLDRPTIEEFLPNELDDMLDDDDDGLALNDEDDLDYSPVLIAVAARPLKPLTQRSHNA
jgi:replication-associated recombination protein RarA